jgi:hypothetical protein
MEVFSVDKRMHAPTPDLPPPPPSPSILSTLPKVGSDVIVGALDEMREALLDTVEMCRTSGVYLSHYLVADCRKRYQTLLNVPASDDKYTWYVFTRTWHQYKTLHIKLGLGVIEQQEQGDKRYPLGPGIAATTQPLVRPDNFPFQNYGLRYLTDNIVTGGGERYAPLWACCLRPKEDPGCLIGFSKEHMDRVAPYKWFGGLQTFEDKDYDDIVRNGRGVVYLYTNLARCNTIHDEIVNILLEPFIKSALLEDPAKRLNTPAVLVQLWRVAQLMHEYNKPLFPSQMDVTVRQEDMTDYLRVHLPAKVWQKYVDQLKQDYLDTIEKVKSYKTQTSDFVKKAKDMVKRLEDLKKKLQEAQKDEEYEEFSNLPSLFEDYNSILGKI